MGKRLKLQSELLQFTPNVYYQPPESVKLTYPCIVYGLSRIVSRYADNKNYMNHKCYNLTYISLDPVEDLLQQILNHFKLIRLDRIYTADNLYHYSFVLFY